MSDNKARRDTPERRKRGRGMEDRERINIDRQDELGYWAREFEVSEEQVRKAVKAVGTLTNDVRAYIVDQVFRTGEPLPARRATPNR